MTYEQVVQAIYDEDIEIIEMNFRGGLKGLYSDNTIAIRSGIATTTEKKCILMEELGHHYTTTGNITDLKSVCNRKQEGQARKWSYELLVPLKLIIKASYSGCTNLYELAEYLDVTEEFLKGALEYYQSKCGLYAEVGNYCIYFNPLTVCKYKYEK
jgi:Zn-dependent peptidase ImmA (M78 family)